MGMCGEHFVLIKHPFFTESRPREITGYTICARGGLTVTRTPIGTLYEHFQCDFGKTVFLTPVIAKGVYQWTVKIEQYGRGQSMFYMGTALADRIMNCENCCLGLVKGSCSAAFTRLVIGTLYCSLIGVEGHPRLCAEEAVAPEGTCIGAEMDSSTATLSFFVNGRKVPNIVSGVEFPSHMGMSLCRMDDSHLPDRMAFTSLSFRRLPHATPSAIACNFYRARLYESYLHTTHIA